MNRVFTQFAPQGTSFEQCIKCTVCTAYCPVSKANPDYPGPKQCGPDGERLRIKNPAYYDEALKYCTNCKRCETACPSGVKIGDMIAVARGKYGQEPLNPKRIRDYILSHTDLFGSLASPFAPVVNAMTALPVVKKAMHQVIGVDQHKALPKYSHGTFRRWFKQHQTEQARYAAQVAYFHGCYVNYNHPQLGKDLVKVLNAMNIGVRLLAREKCCGVPLMANGFHHKARQNAQANIQAMITAVGEDNIPVLATSSTCSYTLQQEYPHVLGVDNSPVADNIEYVTRFLLRMLMNGRQLTMKPLNLKVAYHTPCHLERSGQAIFTIELLKMIPGVTVTVLDSECCGLAGTYGFKAENYPVSMKIGAHLFESIDQSGADLVITDCETCKWQIEENTRLEAIHPISLLAMAVE
ncbi:anaerobic glycerol-3-phosphate dehydrogenase subunit GlpC [Vibrio rhizosphaerae]|uniref:anaerobic glycerol-3-phosphate dehydrogenase subunit GlpC n=1 Tax=Vibrio rhizosphaerae TaxID=398736 RepID=UPI00056FDCE7|nr:anaerobic glycerol-3-phosphate dehydrogenase subunit GlpC [Vibrio rhizosphaerae]